MARNCNNGAAASLLPLLLITAIILLSEPATTAAGNLISNSGRKCRGAACTAARGGGNEEFWVMEPETAARGFINPFFAKYQTICYGALRIGPICDATRLGSCLAEKVNLKRNCGFLNRSCIR